MSVKHMSQLLKLGANRSFIEGFAQLRSALLK